MAKVTICDLCFKQNPILVVARPSRYGKGTDICKVCWEKIIDKVTDKIIKKLEKE